MQSASSSWPRLWVGSVETLTRKWRKSLVAPAWAAVPWAMALTAPPEWSAAPTTKSWPSWLAIWRFCCAPAARLKWPRRTWPSSWARTKATSSSDWA